jgi:hypothetical protein
VKARTVPGLSAFGATDARALACLLLSGSLVGAVA